MRYRLWALQHHVEIVALNSDRFKKSISAFQRIYGVLEGHFRYSVFLPCSRPTLGNNLDSFVALAPLLNPVKANDSYPVSILTYLDTEGVLSDFVSQDTHVYTEDNQIAIVEEDMTK